MITKAAIKIGNKYEVKPKEFHRSLVGTAKRVTDQGIIFEVNFCDMCDREKVSDSKEVLATDFDVKQALGEKCFFS